MFRLQRCCASCCPWRSARRNLGWAWRFANASFWLVWFVVIGVIMRVGRRDHPPTEPGELPPLRKGLAVLSLVFFVLLFMPTPGRLLVRGALPPRGSLARPLPAAFGGLAPLAGRETAGRRLE